MLIFLKLHIDSERRSHSWRSSSSAPVLCHKFVQTTVIKFFRCLNLFSQRRLFIARPPPLPCCPPTPDTQVKVNVTYFISIEFVGWETKPAALSAATLGRHVTH